MDDYSNTLKRVRYNNVYFQRDNSFLFLSIFILSITHICCLHFILTREPQFSCPAWLWKMVKHPSPIHTPPNTHKHEHTYTKCEEQIKIPLSHWFPKSLTLLLTIIENYWRVSNPTIKENLSTLQILPTIFACVFHFSRTKTFTRQIALPPSRPSQKASYSMKTL